MTTKVQLVSNIVGNVSGGASFTGIVTASSFTGNLTGTASTATASATAYGLTGSPNIAVGNITGAAATFTGNVSIAGTLTYEDVTNVDSVGLVTARSGVRVDAGGLVVTSGVSTFTTGPTFIGSGTSTGTASQSLQVTGGGYFSSSVGIGTTNPTSTLHVVGNANIVGVVTTTSLIPAETRFISVAEKHVITSGNTVTLTYNGASSNIGLTTNPTGNITLNVVGIPTSSDFDSHTLTFSVFVNQTGTARSCTAVTLNGVNATIRWSGGSLASAISGVTTSSGMDIYSFTGINTIGSASTTANYYVLGSVNGGYR